MAVSYLLTAQNITTTTAEILVTEDVSPFTPTSGVTVTLTVSDTTVQGTTDTNGVASFTGLTPLTTYTASVTNSTSITFTTLEDTTPMMATASQWKDLANRVNEAVKVGSVVSEPSNVAYVNTANIVDSAVSTSKLADESVTADKIDFSTLGGNYSTSEVSTGFTWLDDSIIYKKTIYVNSLPNNATINIAHEISNLNGVVKLGGVINTAGTYRTLPFVSKNATSDAIEISCDSTNITITTGGSWSSSSAYVTVYYIKNS